MQTSVKTCFKCGRELPLDEFYAHPQMTDGHLNKCKMCARKDVRDNRRKKIDYYRDYDKKRFHTAKRMAQAAQYDKNYRSKYPEKRNAHRLLAYAIKCGRVEKCPCEICGDTNVHAHHEDYSKPLDVIWLCPKHHKWIHR